MDTNIISTETTRASRGFRSSQKPTQQFNDISFGDVLDAFNPLNHIPIISNLKSDNTNPVSSIAKMTGGALLGGPVGLAISAIDIVVSEATGKTMLGNAIETVFGKGAGDSEASATLPAQLPSQQASQRYQSFADAHKRHAHTWRA